MACTRNFPIIAGTSPENNIVSGGEGDESSLQNTKSAKGPSTFGEYCSNDQTLTGLSNSNATLCTYNHTVIKSIGKIRLSVRNPKNEKKHNTEFQIVKEENSQVLGAKTIQRMQLIT